MNIKIIFPLKKEMNVMRIYVYYCPHCVLRYIALLLGFAIAIRNVIGGSYCLLKSII